MQPSALQPNWPPKAAEFFFAPFFTFLEILEKAQASQKFSPKKQDEIKKNLKKSSFKPGNRPKKAQANRGPDFDHFGQAPTKKKYPPK